MPLPRKAPPSWASRETEPQRHPCPPRNMGNCTWPSILPVLCNAAPRLHNSWPGNGHLQLPWSRGALAPLHRGCCRAGTDPPKALGSPCVPRQRVALQHGGMSLCRAAGGSTPPQPRCWRGLLPRYEMGSCNMRPVLLRKSQSGSGAGKSLQCQALPFQSVRQPPRCQVQGKQSCPPCPVCSGAMVVITAMVSLLPSPR